MNRLRLLASLLAAAASVSAAPAFAGEAQLSAASFDQMGPPSSEAELSSEAAGVSPSAAFPADLLHAASTQLGGGDAQKFDQTAALVAALGHALSDAGIVTEGAGASTAVTVQISGGPQIDIYQTGVGGSSITVRP